MFDISKDRNDFIISLFEIIEYYKYLCFKESKKKFENYVDKFLDYIYLFLPKSLRLTIDQNLIFSYIKKLFKKKLKILFVIIRNTTHLQLVFYVQIDYSEFMKYLFIIYLY